MKIYKEIDSEGNFLGFIYDKVAEGRVCIEISTEEFEKINLNNNYR